MSERSETKSLTAHPYWQPQLAAEQDVSLMRLARRRAYVAAGAFVFSLALASVAAWRHVTVALKPHTFIGVNPTSGWFFSGKPEDLRVTPEMERSLMGQIIEAHFARSEKGGIMGLDSFSTEDVRKGIGAALQKGATAYAVSLTIVETREIARNSRQVELHIRGRLTVIEKAASASSEIYAATLFTRGPFSYENPTGWTLTGFSELTRAKFFSREAAAERESIMGAAPKTKKSP